MMPETVRLGCQHRSWSDAEAGQLSLNRSTSSVLSSTPSPGVVGAAIHPSAISASPDSRVLAAGSK